MKDHEVHIQLQTQQALNQSTYVVRLTKVSTAARPAHVQRKHINWDHLQLIIDLQGDIKQINTHLLKEHKTKSAVYLCVILPSSPRRGGAPREPRIEPPRPAPLVCAVGGSAGPGPAVSPVYTRAHNVQQPVCTKSSDTFHAPTLSLTAAVRARRELFTDFTLSDEKFAVNKKSFAQGTAACVCVHLSAAILRGLCEVRHWINRCVISSPWEHI